MITRGFEIQTTDLGQVLNLSNRRVSPVELLELLNLEANCVKILVSLPLTLTNVTHCSGVLELEYLQKKSPGGVL